MTSTQRKTGVALWELDRLVRLRLWEYLRSATSSLKSIQSLLATIASIFSRLAPRSCACLLRVDYFDMPVYDEIRARLNRALNELRRSCDLIASGDYYDAVRSARNGFTLVEEVLHNSVRVMLRT